MASSSRSGSSDHRPATVGGPDRLGIVGRPDTPPTAAREGQQPAKLLERVRKAGSLDALRDDVATRKAMDLLAEQAKAIPAAQAAAREKLWVPDSAKGERRAARRTWRSRAAAS